jgi:hypothetical protein
LLGKVDYTIGNILLRYYMKAREKSREDNTEYP